MIHWMRGLRCGAAERPPSHGWTLASTTATVAVLAALSLAISGCSAPTSAHRAAAQSASGASTSTPDAMATPSAFARSICEPKLRSDLTATLGFTTEVPATSTSGDHLYTCTYSLPTGQLVVSVKKLADSAAARKYFEGLRGHLDRPAEVVGLSSLGLPAFSTPAGQSVYLDGTEILEVDGSGLPPTVGVYGETRNALAAQIAVRIIWPDT